MTIAPDDQGWYAFERDIDPAMVAELHALASIPKMSITKIDLVTVRLVKRLACLRSVESLWLWCDITRRAMRRLIQIPGLKTLDVLAIKGPGSMASFEKAGCLSTFRANCHMSAQDLLCVAKCASIEELGAQGSELTRETLSALLELPHLRSLDIEATRFDDAMAKRLAHSETLTALDIGGTRITGAGLRSLVTMEQLKSLDLWATKLTEDDLALLRELPNLEYVSLGNYDGAPSPDPDRVIPLILSLARLKRIWLDGMRLETHHRDALQAQIESVRIT
jgi:hypothetical protein